MQGCALHGFLSNDVSICASKVQGEAHNKPFPVPARAGKGIKGKGHALPLFARLFS